MGQTTPPDIPPNSLFQAGSPPLHLPRYSVTYRDYISSSMKERWKSTTPHPQWIFLLWLSPAPQATHVLVAPLVKCGGTLGVRMCITERLEEDVGEEPPVQLGIFQLCQPARPVDFDACPNTEGLCLCGIVRWRLECAVRAPGQRQASIGYHSMPHSGPGRGAS